METGNTLKTSSLEIVTIGCKINSPYPERRDFAIYIEFSDNGFFGIPRDLRKKPKEALGIVFNDLVKLMSPLVPQQLPQFKEYVKFCKYCKNPVDNFMDYCLRHRSVVWVPVGIESNWRYQYRFDFVKTDQNTIITMNFNVGRSNWRVYGSISMPNDDIEKSYGIINVTTPKGIQFSYRYNYGKVSSSTYILKDVVDFLDVINDCLNTREKCPSYYKIEDPLVYIY